MTEPTSTGALAGLRVIDFSRFMPGAYFGWIAGDTGAEVIRIENPREIAKSQGHDVEAFVRRRAMQSWQRGRRSLLLNPGHAAAREVLLKLIGEADVLVEDYRRGVMEKMGLGYAEMAKLNPRLIYCSVTLAGQDGPLAARAGHDPIALSLSGALSRLNGQPVPTLPGVQLADVLAGAHAALGIFTALQARERTGRGQHVDAAMSDACMPLVAITMARNEDLSALPPPDGKWHPKGGVWLCGDGGYICTTDMEPRYWARFCDVMGRPDFAAIQNDASRHAEMRGALEAIFLTRPRDEWAALFADADTQAMPVYSVGEAADHPHNRARGAVVDLPHGDETLRHVGTPFRLSDTPPVPGAVHGVPGADSDAILAELGFDAATLRASGAMEA